MGCSVLILLLMLRKRCDVQHLLLAAAFEHSCDLQQV
jgi:hypothetical protein